MGTHPIFESDFDCLTDQSRIQESCLSRSKRSRSSSTLLEERTPPLSRLSETSTTPSSRSDARDICTLLSLTVSSEHRYSLKVYLINVDQEKADKLKLSLP